jgi:zinc transport system substrate-binding protein
MKSIFLLFAALTLALSTFLLSACSSDGREDDGIAIVTTIFPIYDWVRQIIGEERRDGFNLSFVVSGGVDSHNFNPSVSDAARIKTADVFIYVGGHSDDWADTILRDANPDMITLNLMDVLEIGNLIIEGAPCDPDCEDDHSHIVGEFHADEHIWLSLRNAVSVCAAIADVLAKIDPENAQAYRANLEAYTAKLSALDLAYQRVVDAANTRTLVFADRFPFRYLVNDYGLTHYAAFQGCSAETEASFTVIRSLAMRVNQLGINFIMVTENSNQSIARTVIENTTARNQRILVLDSMKSITPAHVRNGATYLGIMESNLGVLKEALH